MTCKRHLSLFPIFVALLFAADEAWKDKQIAEWSEDDARQVLTDSPWAKTVKPTVDRSAHSSQGRSGGGMGRGGGIGIGGIGIGMGGGRRGGMGGPGAGGGYPGGGRRGDDTGTDYNEPPSLKLRWESAFPVRSAELRAREASAPTLDANHYAIAVYGVPNRMANGDSRSLANQLKKQAAMKRDGKKNLKPSSVEVLQREGGPIIVYLFPRSHEITRQDKRIEFEAQIGRLRFSQSFYVGDMYYQGKLEL
jgi:hypothetical protein